MHTIQLLMHWKHTYMATLISWKVFWSGCVPTERDVPLGPITFSLTYMASLEILHYLIGFQYTNHNCLRKCFSGSIQGEMTPKWNEQDSN